MIIRDRRFSCSEFLKKSASIFILLQKPEKKKKRELGILHYYIIHRIVVLDFKWYQMHIDYWQKVVPNDYRIKKDIKKMYENK